jgi:hypothetical protein
MRSDPTNNTKLIGGIVLIVLGLIFFAMTQGILNLSWGGLWPIFLVLVGIVGLARAFETGSPTRRAGAVMGSSIVLLMGAFFFATTLGLLDWSDHQALWPVYPLIVGIALLAGYFASGRERTNFLTGGLIVSAASLVFLFFSLTSTSYSTLGRLWPLFLIAAGILLVVQQRRPARRS